MKIYVYNDYHNGDCITTRPLIRELIRRGLDVAVGAYADRAYLYSDLGIPVIETLEVEGGGLGRGSPTSLLTLCPEDRLPIDAWCGRYPQYDASWHHDWRTIVATFNHQSTTYGLEGVPSHLEVILDPEPVPMIDFDLPWRSYRRGYGPRVYVENGATRSGHCVYEFDMVELATIFPDLQFHCTAKPPGGIINVHDESSMNLAELSILSNQCAAIVGKGSGPFFATYTEVNRFKPRAVVGYTSHPFWGYPGNRLRYLKDTHDLYEFLKSAQLS